MATLVYPELSLSVYDNFLGGRGSLLYGEDPTIAYPTYTETTILGTTLLPRVYGKDLQTFEIASSGIVAVSLDDVHSLDLTRQSSNSNVVMHTLCNDSFELNVNNSNVTLKVDGVNNDMSTYTARNYNVLADLDVSIVASNDLFINGQSTIELRTDALFTIANTKDDVIAFDQTINIGGNFTTTVASNIAVTSVNGSYNLSVNNNAMFVGMNKLTNTIWTHTDNDFKVTASNNTSIESLKDVLIQSSDVANGITHYLEMKSAENKVNMYTSGEYHFNVDGKDLMTIDNSNVFIYGNLNIEGVLNSISVVESKLEVQDKIIYLATNSNYLDSLTGPEADYNYEYDGVTNDGAGVTVHGVPSSLIVPVGSTVHQVAPLYEKSIKWHQKTTGVLGLGGLSADDESRWEVKGGGLYITNNRIGNDGLLASTTSFGFRVNVRDELELVKVYVPEGMTESVTRTVAKFGYTLPGSIL